MADDTNDPTKIFGSLGGETKDIVDAFFKLLHDQMKSGAEDAKDLTSAIDKLGDQAKKNSQSLTVLGASANFKSLQDPLDKIIGSMMKLGTFADTSKIFEGFSKGTQQIGDMNKGISIATGGLDKIIDLATKRIAKMDEGPLKDTAEAALNVAAELESGFKNFISNAQAADDLEHSFVGLSAAGGDLSSVFEGQGGQLKDLQALTTSYSAGVANAADVTKYGVHQTMDMANALKQIPGIYDQMITSGDKGNESTTSLIGVMNLMTGTGQSQETVIHNLTKAYDDFATSGDNVASSAQKGAEFLATISSVSSSLKLRFQDVQDTMQGVADQFRFVGNETDAAAKTIGKYTDALRESGVSGKAALEITKGMIDGIREMSVGTKAFLSLRSGGPGGLQGAFQIDQLLRQGKLDQVASMAERSLRQQIGGRIVTQDQSAQSPQAAAQYMRQQQLLQSGVFGIGKGMGADQIGKLIDAMAKGDTKGMAAQIKTGQDAVTAATKQGTQLQDRANNSLKDISRSVEKGALYTQIVAGAMIRNTMGVGVTGQTDKNARDGIAGTGMAIGLREQRIGIQTGGGGNNPDEVTRQLIMLTRGAENVSGAIKGVLGGVGKSIVGIKDATMDAISALHQMIGEAPNPMSPQIYANATKTGKPTNSIPAHMQSQGTKSGVSSTNAPGSPMTIRLEISHPEGMTVKKSDTSSIHKHNQASTVINFDNQ
jgi:hypothetical protein